jgi:hypothetical protein
MIQASKEDDNDSESSTDWSKSVVFRLNQIQTYISGLSSVMVRSHIEVRSLFKFS